MSKKKQKQQCNSKLGDLSFETRLMKMVRDHIKGKCSVCVAGTVKVLVWNACGVLLSNGLSEEQIKEGLAKVVAQGIEGAKIQFEEEVQKFMNEWSDDMLSPEMEAALAKSKVQLLKDLAARFGSQTESGSSHAE